MGLPVERGLVSHSLHLRRRSTLIRRRSARATLWGVFFLLLALPSAYRMFVR
jgi:hypothetical protein